MVIDKITTLLRRNFFGIPVWTLLTVSLVIIIVVGYAFSSQSTIQPASGIVPGSGNSTSSWAALSVFVKLLLFVGALYLSLALFRRWKGGPSNSPRQKILILESIHLSQHQQIHLVKVGKQTLLIGGTDHSMNLISEIDTLAETGSVTEEISESDTVPNLQVSFANILSRTRING